MVQITETTPQDVEQIREWLMADAWHRDDPRNNPDLMITGYGLLSFCLQDNKGPVAYFKLTEDGDLCRIAIQFAPEEIVSKRRLIVALAKAGIPLMEAFAKERGYKGLVFESVNPSLIGFGSKVGFNSVGNNDFAKLFGEQHDV